MTAVRPLTTSSAPHSAPIRPPSARTPARTKSAPAARTRGVRAPKPLRKLPLPAGQPREWYESHNRQLKAMRLAIALLDSGVYTPDRATDRRIRSVADRIGVHRPSRTTCSLVRSLLPVRR